MNLDLNLQSVDTEKGAVSVGTMHLRRVWNTGQVVVISCDDEIIPLQQRIENVAGDAELEEIYNTTRQ